MAARGHHADVGGITPGSMPARSAHIDEEGVLIDGVLLVRAGQFLEPEMRALLGSGRYPARNIDQNIADLGPRSRPAKRAPMSLIQAAAHFGLEVVRPTWVTCRTMARNACGAHSALAGRKFEYAFDDGALVRVAIRIDHDASRGHDRFFRHQSAAGEQLQCATSGRQGRGAVRVSHAGARRHSDQRRLHAAPANDSCPKGLWSIRAIPPRWWPATWRPRR